MDAILSKLTSDIESGEAGDSQNEVSESVAEFTLILLLFYELLARLLVSAWDGVKTGVLMSVGIVLDFFVAGILFQSDTSSRSLSAIAVMGTQMMMPKRAKRFFDDTLRYSFSDGPMGKDPLGALELVLGGLVWFLSYTASYVYSRSALPLSLNVS
jgi:hypothetical protein